MKFIRLIAIVALLASALGQLNRLFIGGNENVVLYANDLLIGGLMVVYLAYVLVARRSWTIPPIILMVWSFLAIGSLGLLLSSQLLSANELAVSAFYLVRYLSYTVLFFVAYDSLVYATDFTVRQYWITRWSVILLVTTVLVALSGFVQLFVLPDLGALAKYGWDPHVNRLVTSMLDPNYAGCYLSLGVGLAVSWFLYARRLATQMFLLPVIVLLSVAILLTYSRSGYLMLAIVLSIIAVVKSRWLLVTGAIVAIMAMSLVPRVQQRVQGALQGDATTSARQLSWENSWAIAKDNLVIGVGFNTYRYAQDRYGIIVLDKSGNAGAGADSSWLFILATTGGLGLIAFVASYAGFGWFGLKAWKRGLSPEAQAFGLAFMAGVVGLGVASQFNNALFYTWILEIFWVMAGVTVAIASVHGASPADKTSLAEN